MEQQNIPNDVWLSPFFIVKLETPTGNPKYGMLTVELVRHSPRESFIAFTTQRGDRVFLPLTEEQTIYYAEYEGRRYPVYMKVGEVFSIFYLNILRLFTHISKDWGEIR